MKPVEARSRVEGVGFGSRRHLGVERNRDQGKPRCEIGHCGLDERRQHCSGFLAGGLRSDSNELAEQGAKRGVRLAHRVLLAERLELLEPESESPQLTDQARLAHTGLAHELDHLQLPHSGGVHRVRESGQLGIAPNGRRRVGKLARS